MKLILAATLALGLTALALPALAQTPAAGNGPVAGEGPGGTGAGQSNLGPSKAFLRARHHPRYRHHRRHMVR